MPRRKITGNVVPFSATELGDPGVPKSNILSLKGSTIADAIPKAIPKPLFNVDLSETKAKDGIRVTLMKDNTLEYPDLFLDVFVAGPQFEEVAFAKMFSRSRCKRAKSVLEADLVIFTGGPDVDPQLYGEVRHPQTVISSKRDNDDMALYLMCLEHGIPMLGICRGAQFLHVMNGGKLYQHVDNHHGDHVMHDIVKGTRIEKVSSVHHQMVIPNNHGGFQLLATANVARNRWKNPVDNDLGTKIDTEAFFYRDTCCIGIQGHPEYTGYNYFAKWTLDLINELVMMNPDVEWRRSEAVDTAGKPLPSSRRLKEEFVKERTARAKGRHGALI